MHIRVTGRRYVLERSIYLPAQKDAEGKVIKPAVRSSKFLGSVELGKPMVAVPKELLAKLTEEETAQLAEKLKPNAPMDETTRALFWLPRYSADIPLLLKTLEGEKHPQVEEMRDRVKANLTPLFPPVAAPTRADENGVPGFVLDLCDALRELPEVLKQRLEETSDADREKVRVALRGAMTGALQDAWDAGFKGCQDLGLRTRKSGARTPASARKTAKAFATELASMPEVGRDTELSRTGYSPQHSTH